MDCRNQVDLAYTDFSNVIDKVSKAITAETETNCCFKEYSNNFNHEDAKIFSFRVNVSQGSGLGPLLFVNFICRINSKKLTNENLYGHKGYLRLHCFSKRPCQLT